MNAPRVPAPQPSRALGVGWGDLRTGYARPCSRSAEEDLQPLKMACTTRLSHQQPDDLLPIYMATAVSISSRFTALLSCISFRNLSLILHFDRTLRRIGCTER